MVSGWVKNGPARLIHGFFPTTKTKWTLQCRGTYFAWFWVCLHVVWFQIRFLELGLGPAQEVVLTRSSANSKSYLISFLNCLFTCSHNACGEFVDRLFSLISWAFFMFLLWKRVLGNSGLTLCSLKKPISRRFQCSSRSKEEQFSAQNNCSNYVTIMYFCIKVSPLVPNKVYVFSSCLLDLFCILA